MNIPVALQLYTLRSELEKDFIGTLKKVADLGYKGVEFAGFGGFSALELKSYLDAFGLKPAGAHIGIEQLTGNLDQVIDYNLQLGNKYIVCPWASFEGKEDYLKMAELLKEVGTKLKNSGLQLCYHNHAHELEKFEGEYGLDIIYNKVPAELLKAEIDTYWVTYAGLNPVEYIKKYADRIPLLHIKDMENSENREFAEIGTGTIDIKAIAKQSEKNETEWLIVEQDVCKREPLESVRISLENLRKMNLA
ncbi:sugar phosphate isomerase/epimerase [Clostridium swellfunianum]|uniref:sugar phosphate isomerase/epimerase family protein n=1 Tax=Clostridium swellfunianum TaxID=1367462 RepID=UPI00202E16DB|nr:sugar phosphate isomerase/epimerase [Clostridium swellfunianum]MCM0650849.1 sugar phosphate isomerase/epimerase [Clostridium swellfunianum]